MEEHKTPLKFSNMKPLEVIEPYNPQVVEFETVNDFNIYYNKQNLTKLKSSVRISVIIVIFL